MGSNPFGAIHDCCFILCCDARQPCKALQSKQIKKANVDLLGSFEYESMMKYVHNVRAALVKRFAPCICIAQYNASSEPGIVMGSNPS